MGHRRDSIRTIAPVKPQYLALALFATSITAAGADPVIVSVFRAGDRIELHLTDGSAELEWITQSTFRFSRWWSGKLDSPFAKPHDSVPFVWKDRGTEIETSTEYLTVRIQKKGVLLSALGSAGVPLMRDLTPISRGEGVLWLEREAPQGTRYFGLGARVDSRLDARGSRLPAREPFLVASRGYGELHSAPGAYTFDLALSLPDRYRIELRGADHAEYYFFFGPSVKEVFEQRLVVEGPPPRLTTADLGTLPWTLALVPRTTSAAHPAPTGSWDELRDAIHSLVQGSLSGILLGEFDAAPYAAGSIALANRALQFGAVVPVLRNAQAPALRKRLLPFFLTYSEEARERGYPVIHSLPFQFPKDPEGARQADEFMLGDELLVAPVYSPDGKRSVYLPQGVWTDLLTNEVFKGRQTIHITQGAEGPPMFARNGTILPLASDQPGGPMALHYFPSLGAEFFLFETDREEWSQVHAAPAGDYLRLEIESKKTRDYEWVVHNTGSPATVSSGEWSYDLKNRNLHVRCLAQAGEDLVINISFSPPEATGEVR